MGYPDMMRDIMEQTGRETIARRRRDLRDRPIIDSVTGFYNTDYFYLRLEEEIARSRRYGNDLSLIFIDTSPRGRDDEGMEGSIDENTMPAVAGIVDDCPGGGANLAFAYGAGRLAVIMPETTIHEASMAADNIREKILREKIPGVIPLIGIAQYRNHQGIDELIRDACDELHRSSR
ncbi:MAG: diguanylate cyclase [Syntrophales bacterium]|nr:diguanylate cyclase [Syntrophales bacterium]